jgi:hypothetical protein
MLGLAYRELDLIQITKYSGKPGEISCRNKLATPNFNITKMMQLKKKHLSYKGRYIVEVLIIL